MQFTEKNVCFKSYFHSSEFRTENCGHNVFRSGEGPDSRVKKEEEEDRWDRGGGIEIGEGRPRTSFVLLKMGSKPVGSEVSEIVIILKSSLFCEAVKSPEFRVRCSWCSVIGRPSKTGWHFIQRKDELKVVHSIAPRCSGKKKKNASNKHVLIQNRNVAERRPNINGPLFTSSHNILLSLLHVRPHPNALPR